MRITADQPEAQLGGLQSNNFQLTNSAKIIDIVINKMYTNKPGAIIRELGANAWDAHCAKGNPEKPFEINLPTWLDKTFSIRDYGCGIPHDRFEFIYTNIGGSTKDGNDDFIGGFGLGSKTPFTMVDSFTVENWRDGKKSTWLCFKSAGQPKVTMLSSEPTSEPSGLKVSFTFEEDEVGEFTRQVTKQLRYFPTKPLITGGEGVEDWAELPDGWETKDYFYTKDNSWRRSHYVVMGNVAYELNTNEVDYSHQALFQYSLTLKVDIGTVDIPPSRENLEYTAKTKKYLNDVLTKIRKQYNDDFSKEINACTDYLELRKKFYNANSSLITINKFTFDNVEYLISDLRNSKVICGEHGLTIKEINKRYANVFKVTSISMKDVTEGLDLYVNDLGVGANAHINNEYSKIPSGCYIIDPPKGITKTRKSLLDADIAQAKKFFGIEPKLLSSVIGMPQVSGTQRSKTNQIYKLVKTGDTITGCLEKVTEIPTEGYMLEMVGWDVTGFFFNKLKELSKVNSELKAGLDIYLVRKNSRKLCTQLKDEIALSHELDKLLIPKYIAYKNKETYRKLVSSFNADKLNKLNWREVDNVLYLFTSFHRRMLRRLEKEDCLPLYANKLIKEVPKTSLFISNRAKCLLDTYNVKYSYLVNTLRYNLIPFHKFLSTQENK